MGANSSISALIEQFQLQTRLYNNCLEGFSKDFTTRPGGNTNHAAWLAGHLLNTRLDLANLLGMKENNPYGDLYKDFKPLSPSTSYPQVEKVTKHWNELAGKLIDKLNGLDDKFINSPWPFPVPIGDSTMKGTLAFFAHHEAYHLGQLGFVRRFHGYEGMKY